MPPIGNKNTIRVEGLAQLERALGRIKKDARKELNRRLRAVGEVVEREAHTLIRSKGLTGGIRSTGELDRLTRTVVSSTGAVLVRSGAMRKHGANAPFNYPRVWEFSRAGQRAFLLPALERGRGAALLLLDDVLNHFESVFAE